jgi:hypothetical protein
MSKRLIKLIGSDDAESLRARLLTNTSTMLDCILIEYLLWPSKEGKRRKLPKVWKEQIAIAAARKYQELRARGGNDGAHKNVRGDLGLPERTLRDRLATAKRKRGRIFTVK